MCSKIFSFDLVIYKHLSLFENYNEFSNPSKNSFCPGWSDIVEDKTKKKMTESRLRETVELCEAALQQIYSSLSSVVHTEPQHSEVYHVSCEYCWHWQSKCTNNQDTSVDVNHLLKIANLCLYCEHQYLTIMKSK